MLRSPSSGQASIEWVAVLAVVAVLLSAGAALADGPSVGRRVTRAMARALCVVGNGDCWRDREPCVVDATREQRDRHVEVLILRVGQERVALVERRSDGTVAVSWAGGRRAGYEIDAGPSGHVGLGHGLQLAIGGTLRASALATSRDGRTWIVPSEAAAQRLLTDLRAGRDVREPDVVYGEQQDVEGAGASVNAGVEIGGHAVNLADAAAGAGRGRIIGGRRDRRTGHRTLYATTQPQASAEAQGAGGVLGVSRSASPSTEVYAMELDEHGRAIDLSVVAAGTFDGSADLPDVAQPVAGRLAIAAHDTRLYEVEAHLDLTDAGNLAAAQDLVATLSTGAVKFGDHVAASAALRRRIAEHGTIDARVLDVATDTSSRGISTSFGGKLGAGQDETTRTTVLLAAASRGLDGQWIARDDCTGTSDA